MKSGDLRHLTVHFGFPLIFHLKYSVALDISMTVMVCWSNSFLSKIFHCPTILLFRYKGLRDVTWV